jgi:hypothetical protein
LKSETVRKISSAYKGLVILVPDSKKPVLELLGRLNHAFVVTLSYAAMLLLALASISLFLGSGEAGIEYAQQWRNAHYMLIGCAGGVFLIAHFLKKQRFSANARSILALVAITEIICLGILAYAIFLWLSFA